MAWSEVAVLEKERSALVMGDVGRLSAWGRRRDAGTGVAGTGRRRRGRDWDSPFGHREDRFRSRSLPRFPCGTKGFGITTEYFGPGEGKQEQDKRSGSARMLLARGVIDAGDEGGVDGGSHN